MRLIPRVDAFEDLLVELTGHVLASINLLAEMLGQDQLGRETLTAQISQHEVNGDDVSHRIAHRINDSLVTPFDRDDILALAHAVDECLDRVELVAEMITLLRVGELPTSVNDQLAVLQRQGELSVAVMSGLSRGKDHAEYWVEINRLENRGDRVYRRAVAELLNNGIRTFGSVEAMLRVREVVDRLEDAVDSFERLAERVEIIAVKES